MSQFYGDAIFWIETEKIRPNPYQPRREFDEERLRDLAESIRMYGVLQPLVVTRREVIKPDGGFAVEYELISGERRLRASQIAGVQRVPAIIRTGTDDARIKLELAIIENLQREDLNVVERAQAFQRLVDEFSYQHTQIAKKIGRSREYVSNSIRVLSLPAQILQALAEKKITEGHTRPILMLTDRPEAQHTLFQNILGKGMTVRESEKVARGIAVERARKKEPVAVDHDMVELEAKLAEALGTRVQIERREKGGKIMIDFFSSDDLTQLVSLLEARRAALAKSQGVIPPPVPPAAVAEALAEVAASSEIPPARVVQETSTPSTPAPQITIGNERSADSDSDDLYSIRNFSV